MLRVVRKAHEDDRLPGGMSVTYCGADPVKRFSYPLHQDEESDVLPLGEILPGELGGVERDIPLSADLEDSPHHPYVSALPDPPSLFAIVLPVLLLGLSNLEAES